MKISNSKKQLARIISENGGWRDVAEWAAQDAAVAFFSGGKPEYATQDKVWCANGDNGSYICAMGADDKIKCFHNTILSRDEYFHLHPAPDAVSTLVGEPEHVWTNPPTIEQLAADYRAKLTIAQKAQEEADSHRCGAEAALEKLVAAGKALGLVLGVAAPEPGPEPELTITDRRGLLVGDVVEVTGSDNPGWVRLKGVESVVTRIGPLEDDVILCPRNDDTYWAISDNTEWRFIRRP